MSTVGRRRAVRSDALANRLRLLETAEVYFGEHGIDAPLKGLAVACGVGEATLYRHFPSHADLVRALYDRIAERIDGLVAQVVAEPTHGGRIETFLRGAIRLNLDNPASPAVMARQLANDPDHRPGSKWDAVVRHTVAGAVEEGWLRPDVVGTDIAHIPHLFQGFAHYPEPMRSTVVERQFRIVLDGLRADGRERTPLAGAALHVDEFHAAVHGNE